MFAISEMLSGSMSPGGAAPPSAFKMEAICPQVKEADKDPKSPQGPMDGEEEAVRYNGESLDEHRGDTEGENCPSDSEGDEDPDSEPALVISEDTSVDFTDQPPFQQNPHQVLLSSHHQSTSSSGGGGSVRRNKRKDFKPRNIVSFSYESEEVDMEEGCEAGEDGCSGEEEGCVGGVPSGAAAEQPLDLAAKRTLWARRSERESTPMDLRVRGDLEDLDDEDDSGDDGGSVAVAAVSTGASAGASTTSAGPASNGLEDPAAVSSSAAAVMDLSGRMAYFFSPYAHSPAHPHHQLHHPHKSPDARRGVGASPADASAMKEYAENTMKELLSMYGLNDVAESITKHVPIANFSSGKILETFSAGKGVLPGGLSSLHMSALPVHLQQQLHLQYAQQAGHPQPSCSPTHRRHPSPSAPPSTTIAATTTTSSSSTPPAQPPTPPRTPHTPRSTNSPSPQPQHQQVPPPPHLLAPNQHPHLHATADGMWTMASPSASKAAADSVGKMAGLSPNSLLGGPHRQMMLPDNMARILALAAFQEQVQAVGSSPGVDHKSSIPNSPHPGVVPSGGHLPGHLPPLAGVGHLGHPREGVLATTPPKQPPIDYTRYVKRFANAAECGSAYCKDLNYREHFHCLDCNSRVFIKKEEMIRHFKWHKKRDESLQHGFMRYSPMDDCLDRFRNCNHNRKQTHYHCLQEGCDKVYISTSDVQMHANYHRKDSAIIQEGFQRFRATEDCGAVYCSFYGQRTTHFHCRRPGCKYTFKNKADMEKHKSYHIKDEQLIKDGFKKFMKHEYCCFENCRFSRVCNHIHCIRPGCSYVLHSSGQLYSHKRKHERKDNELAYRKFKLAQSMMKTMGDGHSISISPVAMHHHLNDQLAPSHQEGSPLPSSIQTSVIQGPMAMGGVSVSMSSSSSSSVGTTAGEGNKESEPTPTNVPCTNGGLPLSPMEAQASNSTANRTMPHPYGSFASIMSGLDPSGALQYTMPPTAVPPSLLTAENLAAMDLTNDMLKAQQEEIWKKYLMRYAPHDKCKPECEFQFKDHYHCYAEGCDMAFRSKDGVREHARNHEQQEQVTASFYNVTEAGQEPCQCPTECLHQNRLKHYHCTWENCREVILPTDKPFRRLDHYKMHEYSRKLSMSKDPMTMTLATSIDGLFKRKRGRPPKNRVIEFPMSASQGLADMPQAIFTSFKLPKPMMPMAAYPGQGMATAPGLQPEAEGVSPAHSPLGQAAAGLPGLKPIGSIAPHFMAQAIEASSPTAKMEVQEGFYVFANGSACPDLLCPSYGKQHFHCSQPRCFYVTDREDMLIMHSKDFHDNIDIMEGFVFFDRTIDCRHPSCPSNKVNRHFHCTRPNCGFTFVRYSTMAVHEQSHKEPEDREREREVMEAGEPSSAEAVRVKTESPHSAHSPQPGPTSDTPPRITVVKAAGTYYPLSAFPTSLPQGKVVKSESNPPTSRAASPVSSNPSSPQPPKPGGIVENGAAGYDQNSSVMEAMFGSEQQQQQALTKLLQQPSPDMQRFDWSLLDRPTKYGPEQSCGRPFCKLKRKEHYHCHACNQAFSELEKLKPHIQKHSSGALSPNSSRREGEDDSDKGSPIDSHAQEESSDSSSPHDHSLGAMKYELPRLPEVSMPPHSHSSGFPDILSSPYALLTSQGIPMMQHGGLPVPAALYTTAAGMMFATPTLARAMPSAMKETPTPPSTNEEAAAATAVAQHCLGMPMPLMGKRPVQAVAQGSGFCTAQDMTPEAKKARIQNSMRILKDEPVPEGYIRFRFNEDCKYPHCGYREHQTHFHCIRKDCGYSFCDKTRFVQHTARHERLDTLMGGDFQQFRANVPCGRFDCIYTSTLGTMQNKASHFHCLKCDFVCTDTNKVVAHRRQHQKLDSIMAAGFEKFTPSQICSVEGCAHNQKQTHYHCLKCHYAVLGLSQMSAHKYRHLE